MDISGKWKAFGGFRYAISRDDSSNFIPIEIEGNVMIRRTKDENGELQEIKHKFELREACGYMREYNCRDILIEGDEHHSLDYMVHEETIGDKTVAIISFMGMEFDGRGRIVMCSFIREEDFDLVDENYVTKAYIFWNRRASTSTIQFMNPMLMEKMMANNPMALNMEMINTGMADIQANPEPAAPSDGWDCSCGSRNNTHKFCPECGAPRP